MVAKRASAGRSRDDGDRDAARARGARPRPDRRRPRARLVLRAAARALRRLDRGRRPVDRADGDERGGVVGAGRAAPLAGVHVRALQPRRGGAPPSSSCARSIAATATGWSPTSARAASSALVECRGCRAKTASGSGSEAVGQDHHPRSKRPCCRQNARVVLTASAEMCECPPRGQVVQTNCAAVRRVPGHLQGIAATAGRPSVWGFVDESTFLRRRRARRSARGRGHHGSVRASVTHRAGRGEQDHRLAAGRRAVGLARPRGRGQPGVRGQAPRHERRRPVPDLGRPPEQVRRHARRRQHA